VQEVIRAILLGVVQGATEFIPVSSSGHLVIIPWLFGWEIPPDITLLMDTVLHWGTLLSIMLVFWRDFLAMIVACWRSLFSRSLADVNARIGWFIVLGSIPTAVVGLAFKDFFETLFVSSTVGPLAAGISLLITAAVLSGSELLVRNAEAPRTLSDMNVKDAIAIGIAQSFALLPGLSRSGVTIAAGLVRKLRRDAAARFSFMLGTPAFLGAGLLQMIESTSTDADLVMLYAPAIMAGFVASAITGYFAIRFLLAYLRRRNLYIFAVYCTVVGIGVILLSLYRA